MHCFIEWREFVIKEVIDQLACLCEAYENSQFGVLDIWHEMEVVNFALN